MNPQHDLQYQRHWLEYILNLAKIAGSRDEVPVGALITKGNQLIATGFNEREASKDVTSHAEIIAIRRATQQLKQWRLIDCHLYTTLEPCVMCAGAISQSRIPLVSYLAKDPKGGGFTLFGLHNDSRLNHLILLNHENLPEDLRRQASDLLKCFFRQKRRSKPLTTP